MTPAADTGRAAYLRAGDGVGLGAATGQTALAIAVAMLLSGCASIRVTNPPQTATEQFLMSQATAQAVAQLSTGSLRGRRVYVDATYVTAATQPSRQDSFLIGEVRAKLLFAGVQLANERGQAQIILELRSGALGVDRVEYLLGIPSLYMPSEATAGAVPVATPELAIVKSTKQKGYADVAFVAYWAETGEIVGSSGPFVGRTRRSDWWFFGFGPRTTGDIPTVDSSGGPSTQPARDR